jgi:hypothetical protein
MKRAVLSEKEWLSDYARCEQAFGDAHFSAHTVEAMQIQERMFDNYVRSMTIRVVSSYSLAAFFGLGAFGLIMFGPAGRETTVDIFSVSFILMAAGIAGFTQLKVRGFGVELESAQSSAGRQLSNSTTP